MERAYAPPPDLHPLLAALLSALHHRHREMATLVSGLPAGALDWQPGEDVRSLAGLVHRITDIESRAARAAGGDDLDAWDEPAPTRVPARSAAGGVERELLAEIEACDALLKAVVPSLTDVARVRELAEECDRASMHYGDLRTTRLLWAQAHPAAAHAFRHWAWPA